MTLEDIKLYCRIDSDDEDALLLPLIETAKQFLTESAHVTYDEKNNLHELFIKLLVANWYENRLMNQGNDKEIPYSLSCILNHIAIHEGAKS
jgi:uncharacterized phage protein (predicted DNA packaging)